MKSRLVALALAAVMTLGSCMSASAKDVFTKGMIGATVVKNGAYVENVDVIDVAIWEAANKDSLYTWVSSISTELTKAKVNGDTVTTNEVVSYILGHQYIDGTKPTSGSTLSTGNNAYSVAFASLTTDQQRVLLAMIQEYGQTVAKFTTADTAPAAPYVTGWSYDRWVSQMQIAPYAERYIVALNYKNVYKNLKELADKSVAQGQITVSDAYANNQDLSSVKTALHVLDALYVENAPAGDLAYSGAKFRINGADVPACANTSVQGDYVYVTYNGERYYMVPAVRGLVDGTPVTVGSTPYTGAYYAIPANATTAANLAFYTSLTAKTITRVPAGSQIIYDPVTPANNRVGTVVVSPIQVLISYATYTSQTYREDADNALAIAKEMQASFKKAMDYYDGQIKGKRLI